MLEMRVSRSFVRTSTYDFLKRSVSQVLDIIAEGQQEGVIRTDVDQYIIRHLVLGILEDMVSRWLLKGEKYDLLERYEEVSRLLIDAIRTPPHPRRRAAGRRHRGRPPRKSGDKDGLSVTRLMWVGFPVMETARE